MSWYDISVLLHYDSTLVTWERQIEGQKQIQCPIFDSYDVIASFMTSQSY